MAKDTKGKKPANRGLTPVKRETKKGVASQAKVGRPSAYRPEHAPMARKLCLLKGMTDAELGAFFEVSETTINNWKREHPEFLASIKEGKEIADANVAASLYERACGYTHDDVHVSNFQGQITLTPLKKHYPPDTAAAFIWLKNRRKEDWRDRFEHTGPNGEALPMPVIQVLPPSAQGT